MDEGAPLLDLGEMLRDASGRDIECLASRVPLRDQAGNLIGMLGVFVAIPDARPSERGECGRADADAPRPAATASSLATRSLAGRRRCAAM